MIRANSDKKGIVEYLKELGCEISSDIIESNDSSFYHKVKEAAFKRINYIKDIKHFKAKTEVLDIQEAFLITSLNFGFRETRRHFIDIIKRMNLKFFARGNTLSILNLKVNEHNLQLNRDIYFKFFLDNKNETGIYEGSNFVVTKMEDKDRFLKVYVSIKEYEPIKEDIIAKIEENEELINKLKKYEDKGKMWFTIDDENLVVDERLSMAKATKEELLSYYK